MNGGWCGWKLLKQNIILLKIKKVTVNILYVAPLWLIRQEWSVAPSILNIEGAINQFMFRKLQWSKMHNFIVTFLIFNRIIFCFHGFQPHHPPFISTMHILLFINCSLSTLLLKSTVPWSSLLTRCSFLYWFHHRSYKKLPGTFHFLTKPGFFSCVVTAKPLEYNITTLCHISTSITKLGWSSIHSKSAL